METAINPGTRQQWLDERRTGIGGSDVAAILGLNPWSSPYAVWADKLGLLPEKEDNEAMRQGRDFEDYVARRFCEVSGKKVRRVNKILRHPKHYFMLANIDRDVVGENAGLECKTTSVMNLSKFKNGEYPANYYCQCVHYMAVTGAARWYLAVLVLNRGFMVFEIERDEDEIDALIEAETEFWKLVEAKTPPPADGSEATTEAIRTIHAESGGGMVELFGREALVREYYTQRDARDTANTRMEEIRQTLMLDLGDNESGACGIWNITWKPQTRRTFDAKRFATEHPNMDLKEYYNTSTFRKFDIREAK